MAVEVGAIEKELAALWRQAAERARTAGGELAVLRAALWNFIVHHVGEAGLAELKALLDEASRAVPARIIVLLEQHAEAESLWGTAEPLRAFVEATLRLGPDGRREVVAEEITLEARVMEMGRLPALVRSLLLPDLPMAALVRAAPACARLAPLLAEADRIIFDSGRGGPEPLGPMERLLRTPHPAGGTLAERAEVTDLGWMRTASWRRIIASMFEGAAVARLGALDEVRVRYAAGAAPAAHLLLGWLATRLGWHLPGLALGPEGGELRDAGGRPLRIRLEVDEDHWRGDASPGPRPLGGLVAVELRAGTECFHAGAVGDHCVEVRCPGRPLRREVIRDRTDAELLIGALGAFGRDPLMRQALGAALQLLGVAMEDELPGQA